MGTLLDSEGRYLAGRPPRADNGRSPRPDLAEPIVVNGETVGYLLIDVPDFRRTNQAAEEAFRDNVRRAVVLSALFATLVALVVGIGLAWTITGPLRELTAATRDLAAGELGLQVPVRGRDELSVLAGSFNNMSSDLAEATRLRRQMTADIAHDLRTPLSVILGYAEALSDGKLQASPEMYDVIYSEAQHLNRLIDDLRILSLADAGELSLDLQPVAPRDVLTRTAATHASVPKEPRLNSSSTPRMTSGRFKRIRSAWPRCWAIWSAMPCATHPPAALSPSLRARRRKPSSSLSPIQARELPRTICPMSLSASIAATLRGEQWRVGPWLAHCQVTGRSSGR